MLQTLSIKNFALIEDITLQLNDRFSIITGETGAGKSILLGALSLLLGKRADLSAIRDSSTKCTIEGTFNVKSYKLKSLFGEHDLDYEDTTIIRREILPSGKSRAFINDTPVNLSAMAALGERLVDIHSQHETLSLGDLDYQYLVLDSFSGIIPKVESYRKDFQQLKDLYRELETLKQSQAEALKTQDYNTFLLEELEKADLKPQLLQDLESRQEQLSNVELLKESLGETNDRLQDENTGVLESLRAAKRKMGLVEHMSTNNKDVFERLQSVIIELEDASSILDRELESIEADPTALEEINEQLQAIYNLFRKHQVDTLEALMNIEKTLAETVLDSQNAEDKIVSLQKEIDASKVTLKGVSKDIYSAREKHKIKLVSEIEALLKDLGMTNASIRINLNQVERFNTYGSDEMLWELSANKGGHFSEIKKAASGGELSRIMLALKSILASKSHLPTIIFDEIDTGVSGEIAKNMADIMVDMGQGMQVISITHLPQIAAKGQHHYKVYKEDVDDVTVTQIKYLDKDERVVELAEMLGGKSKSEAVLAHAKALLN